MSDTKPKKGQRRRANSDGGPAEGSSRQFGKKQVVFDEIMIKEYPIILGDHPAVYVENSTRACCE